MRKATPEEFELFARMRNTITSNARRNQLRTLYAEFEHVVHHRSFRSVWTDVEVEQVPLGWPAKAARVFGGRFSPRPFHFRSGSSLADDLAEAHEMASGVAVEGMAIKASVRHGLGFVFTSAGLPGEPEVISTVRSARQATAIIDPRTRRTTAALEDIGDGWWLLYLPHVVLRVSRRLDGILIVDGEYPTGTRRVLCTPFINDLDAERPYGSSRITREQMELTNAGIRTLSRSEVSAEFYQAPRQVLLGVALEDLMADDKPQVAKALGAIWGIPDIGPEDDQDVPDELRRADIKMLPQMSMQPFTEQMRMIVAQFSQASSVPLHYLGFTNDVNPQSADAIAAHETDLLRVVREQIPYFAMARRQYAVDLLTALYGGDIEQDAASDLRGLSAGYFDPRELSASEASQMVQLQTSEGNLARGGRVALELLPLTPEQRDDAYAENQIGRGASTLAVLREQAAASEPAQ